MMYRAAHLQPLHLAYNKGTSSRLLVSTSNFLRLASEPIASGNKPHSFEPNLSSSRFTSLPTIRFSKAQKTIRVTTKPMKREKLDESEPELETRTELLSTHGYNLENDNNSNNDYPRQLHIFNPPKAHSFKFHEHAVTSLGPQEDLMFALISLHSGA
ncbi:hypothetical protein Droror1_Dr00018263 [Drosera rotundifolia]